MPTSVQPHVIHLPVQLLESGARGCRPTSRATQRAAWFAGCMFCFSGALLAAPCDASQAAGNNAQRIMVEFKNRPRAADAQQLGDHYGLRVIKLFPSAPLAIFELTTDGDPAALMRRLAREPAIRNVELDQRVSHQGPP